MADISKIETLDGVVHNLKDASAIHAITGVSPILIDSTIVSHANSGVTAASKGDTSNQTPSWGGTFKVTSGTVNETGHISTFEEHTVTIPDAVATTNSDGLMSSIDKSAIADLQTQVSALQSIIQTLALKTIILCGTNKSITSSSWSSSGVSTYLYKADISMPGVDTSYFPLVQFSDEDVVSFDFSPNVVPKSNAVTIFCKTKPNRTITIPNVICFQAVSV